MEPDSCPKGYWTTPKFSNGPDGQPLQQQVLSDKKASWNEALSKSMALGKHYSFDLDSDSDIEMQVHADVASSSLVPNSPVPSRVSVAVSCATPEDCPETPKEKAASSLKEEIVDPIEDDTDSVRAIFPSVKRPRTRSIAATERASWSIHAVARARFLDNSPPVSFPGSIASDKVEPGKIYKLIYNSGSTPGAEKTVKMLRWMNDKKLSGLFWDYKTGKPQTLTVSFMQNVRPVSRERVVL